jgi:hypothetical protein
MTPFEVLLPAGAFALYLIDSAMLLYSNELLFVRRRSGWDFVTGSGLLLFGRRLCLVNPFTPNKPQFRIRWSDHDDRVERDDVHELGKFVAVLRPLQYVVVAQLVLVLALPLELLAYGTGPQLLGLFAAYYILIVAALGYSYARRRELRIPGRTFMLLAFDSLACSPFAINLVRKLSLRRSLPGNPVIFAQQSFGAESFERLIRYLCGRIREEQQHEDEQLPRWAQLEAYRRKLLSLLPCQSSS